MSAYKPFTDLEVWKKGREFKKDVGALVKTFPSEEKFRFTDQIIRSVRSVNANISEGHGRFGFPDQIKFCIQARGSLNETWNHLIDAYDCHYISKDVLLTFQTKFNEVMKLLNGYINYLRNLLQTKSTSPKV